VYHS